MEKITRRSFLGKAVLCGAGIPLGGLLIEAGTSKGAAAAATTGEGILICPPITTNIYWDGWSAAAKAAAAALGVSSHYENFNGDTTRQVASFQNMATLGLRGAMTMANVAGASPRLAQICQKQNVYLVNCHNNQPWVTPLDIGDSYYQYLEFANDDAFEAMCTFLFKKMGETGKVIHISGTAGVSASDYRDLGFKRALQKFPKIQLLATAYGNFGRVATVPIVENLLTAHPDVQAIICQNDDSGMGAISVLKKKGIKAYVVGCDGVPEFLDAISAGDALATIGNTGIWLGGGMAVRLFDAINGVKLHPLERMQHFEVFVINTPEAAQAFKALQTGANPYDFKKMSRFLNPDDWDMQTALTQIRPDIEWGPFASQAPRGYKLPSAYQDATAEYDKLDAIYRDHLKSDPFDAIKKLCTNS
jgi:ribose transport system substrate-binding protein